MAIKDDIRLKPGNYAVIFLSEREDNPDGYGEMDEQTMTEVAKLPGFLGYENLWVSPMGIFISYWESKADIDRWRMHTLHTEAKKEGRARWYNAYRSVVCSIEETHFFRR
jgi:heme-degrading monooxygenase HmoA